MRLLDPAFRRDRAAVALLLADGFREHGSSGRIFSRDAILDEMHTESSRIVSLAEFHCEFPVRQLALVTYRSTTTLESGSITQALRCSLWIYRDERWQMLFHQGTPTTLQA